MSRAYTTEGHPKDRTSGSHDCSVYSGWRLKVKTQKCTMHITPARRPMKTTEVRLSALAAIGAQACTATMRVTIAGIMTMIRISRIVNIGPSIGFCGDSSVNNPTASVTAYAISRTRVVAAEKNQRPREVTVNFMPPPQDQTSRSD